MYRHRAISVDFPPWFGSDFTKDQLHHPQTPRSAHFHNFCAYSCTNVDNQWHRVAAPQLNVVQELLRRQECPGPLPRSNHEEQALE